MITTYQIRNVLRVYGNQLKRKNNPIQDNMRSIQYPADLVDISIEARRKQMLSQMSNHLISKTKSAPKGDHQQAKGDNSVDNPSKNPEMNVEFGISN